MIESTILSQLIYNEAYAKKILPFIKLSYFGDKPDKILFRTYVEYFQKYNHPPTLKELATDVSARTDLSDDEFSTCLHKIDTEFKNDEEDFNWLVDKTEQWCQDRAMFNAVNKAISIIDGEDEKRTPDSIPQLMRDALAVSFDNHIGHDYLEDAEARFEYYHSDVARIPFDLKIFNKITNGGVPKKTLNIILAGTNVGKTLGLCHLSAAYLKQGKNVLYITLEMSEEEIANRLDANLMQMNVNDIQEAVHDVFFKHIHRISTKTDGKLIVKQYPTSQAHDGHFRTLLEELKLKKKFIPDVVVVDYIGITASSRVKLGQTGSYGYVKAVAEELRGLGVEADVAMWSAVQLNRDGFGSSDPDLTNTAESFGLPATADFMIAAVRTDELDALNQLMWIQLKSRYGNKNYYNKFVTGVDVDKMTLFDVDQNGQTDIVQTSSIPDKTEPKKSKFGDIEL